MRIFHLTMKTDDGWKEFDTTQRYRLRKVLYRAIASGITEFRLEIKETEVITTNRNNPKHNTIK